MNWLRQVLSEGDHPSFGRTASGLALVAGIAWVSWIVYQTKALPDLLGITAFIAALYGLSKTGESFQKIFSNKQ